jgi:DNA-binding MarR family transcriptional regulator
MELRSLTHTIRRAFEGLSNFQQVQNMTGTNSWIIAHLAENKDKDIFQKDLEKQFCITRATASKVITLMEQKGLIKRETVPYDARLKKIVLTEIALDMHKVILSDVNQIEDALVKDFTEEEITQFFDYIQRMKKNIEALS